MSESTEKADSGGKIEMCDFCNGRRRKLTTILDPESKLEIKMCEDCLFLREFENELMSDTSDDDHKRVLIDYDSFGSDHVTFYPYKWLENYIIRAFIERKAHLDLDDLKKNWPYEVNMENDVLPKFVAWGFLKPVETIPEGAGTKRVIKIGPALTTEFNNHLQRVKDSGKWEDFGNVFKLIDGRISLGVETKSKFKNLIRWKLMKTVLKSGFDKDGKMKDDSKVIEVNQYKCKLCDEVADFNFKIADHVRKKHPEITEPDKIAATIESITALAGVKVPREEVMGIDEIKRYGAAYNDQLRELFKDTSFISIAHTMKQGDDDPMAGFVVITAPWVRVMEKVNMKVKSLVKGKEKIKGKEAGIKDAKTEGSS
jgi:hypothetical protein